MGNVREVLSKDQGIFHRIQDAEVINGGRFKDNDPL